MTKISKTGYRNNSKDKNEPFLQIPSNNISMFEDDGTPLQMGPILGISNTNDMKLMVPGQNYKFDGTSVTEIPMAKNGGTKKVKIQSLSKPPKKDLTWEEYLKMVGVKDPRFLKLTQEEVDAMFDSSGYINMDIVNQYKQTNKEDENDIRVDIYNTALRSLLDDYNKIYPKDNNGSRSLTKNAASLFTWYTKTADGKTVILGDGANSIKLTPKEFDKFRYSNELDPKKNKEFLDAYIKNQKKWISADPTELGSGYRNVPTPWVDATPKYDLKGIDHPGVDDSEFNRDMRGMFRHPVFYNDKILGKENMPLLYTTDMANDYKGSILQREDHYNPAIYPKPNYSMEEVNPVLSGSPNYGSNFRINGQDYTIAQPDQNYIQNQFYGLPISAMPGPSAENIYVDSPNSDWVRNYKNKMNLYNVTQENLARLKEYDPNYNVVTNYDVSDPRYDPYQKHDDNPSNTLTDKYNKRMEGYEQRYMDDPSVGFYQADPNEEINEPCVECGTLYGSKRSADADTIYRTYDVQYPQYGIFKKEDLDPKPRYYIERSGEYGNPGVAHIYRANLTDPTNPQNRDYLGAVLADEWLSGDTLENFYRSGYQYREPIDYEGLKDGRRVWREGTENWDELEPYAILDQRAKEPAERGARERYEKKMKEISDMQVGDPETESRRQQYVKEKLGMLNNFINDLGNPRGRGRDYSGPSFQKGGPATAADSLQIASHADQVANFYRNSPMYEVLGTDANPATIAPWLTDIREMRDSLKARMTTNQMDKEGYPTDPFLRKIKNLTPTKIQFDKYYQDLGNNKFKQRELGNGVLNMDAPMQLFDTRINPQYRVSFYQSASPLLGDPTPDLVNTYKYDKLAVTPWSELNQKQKLSRIKKFGVSGTPFKSKKEAISFLTGSSKPSSSSETSGSSSSPGPTPAVNVPGNQQTGSPQVLNNPPAVEKQDLGEPDFKYQIRPTYGNMGNLMYNPPVYTSDYGNDIDFGNRQSSDLMYAEPYQERGFYKNKEYPDYENINLRSRARGNYAYSVIIDGEEYLVDHPYEGPHKGYGYVNIPNIGEFEIDYRSGKPELRRAPSRFMDGGSLSDDEDTQAYIESYFRQNEKSKKQKPAEKLKKGGEDKDHFTGYLPMYYFL
jgi:hypothetical protein